MEIPDCFSGNCFGSGLKIILIVQSVINLNKTHDASYCASKIHATTLTADFLQDAQPHKHKNYDNLQAEAYCITKCACGAPKGCVLVTKASETTGLGTGEVWAL